MAEVNCNICGKGIEVYPCRVKTQELWFCSRECRQSYRALLPCGICGEDFEATMLQERYLKQGKIIVCSKKCHNKRALMQMNIYNQRRKEEEEEMQIFNKPRPMDNYFRHRSI